MADSEGSRLSQQFAAFLAGRSRLEGADRAAFAELVATLVNALDGGHSCLQVDATARRLLLQSSLVSEADNTPLVLRDDRLYLHRFAAYEMRLAKGLQAIAGLRTPPPVSLPLWAESTDPQQRRALRLALERPLAIICGGPGTGKTTTVAKILVLLAQTLPGKPAMVLAAPTGKAAQRLGEAIASGLAELNLDVAIRQQIPVAAQTIHRLLGVRRFSPGFKHHHGNPLAWDVVVVDEASMVDLALMSKLVDALKPGARLLLLGDKDQLASVESGAVLADLIAGLPENTALLEKSYRFEKGIASLATAINRGDGPEVGRQLSDWPGKNIAAVNQVPLTLITARYAAFIAEALTVPPVGLDTLLQKFNSFRVLCALHHGPRGVAGINRQVIAALIRAGFPCRLEGWFPGRPVLITRNDYSLNLYNGDVGLCLAEENTGELKAWFIGEDFRPRGYALGILPPCETAFAMTIHKSQGSEWPEVVVVLPEEDTPLLTRELVYTAVTRARSAVCLVSAQPLLSLAISRRTSRCSGLLQLLSKPVVAREESGRAS
jgi:exodeoxyribonuclease V alpha subunit